MSTLAKIEALLFVAGEDGIRVRQLAELLSLPPTGIQQSLEKLVQKYEKDPDSSLALIETGGAYRLVTKPQFAEILKGPWTCSCIWFLSIRWISTMCPLRKLSNSI